MSTWAIVPLKPLNRSKSRLSPVLIPEQRQQLAESMFRHVLQVLRDAPEIIGTLVVSRDSKALSIARDYDATTLQETGTPELNAALTRATQVAVGWGVDSILILPADLPLVATEDIANMIALGRGMPSVVIATDQNEDGTNALFMRPPGIIPYAYGLNSFQSHIALAHQSGIDVKTYFSDRLALDIDVSDDLDTYRRVAPRTNTQHFFIAD